MNALNGEWGKEKEDNLVGIFEVMLPGLLHNPNTRIPLNSPAARMYDTDREELRRLARLHSRLPTEDFPDSESEDVSG